jgi:hypothetical protein
MKQDEAGRSLGARKKGDKEGQEEQAYLTTITTAGEAPITCR